MGKVGRDLGTKRRPHSARRWIEVAAIAAIALCAWAAPATANPYTPGAGQIAVDSGFRPEANGYSFANYGNEGNPNNLSPGSMRKLFGDAAVCVGGGAANGGCTLTPAARDWAIKMNRGMAGGHCEGMAITASWFYSGVGEPPSPAPFGSDTVPGLPLQGNPGLQNHIATAFVLQFLQPMHSTKINESPNTVLQALAQNLPNGEPMVLGVYKRGFKGGHAVTPLAIEDRGDGQAAIVVYDNNFPNQLREVNVDTNTNTWNFTATANPNEPTGLYEGDGGSKTLEVEFASVGLGIQPCPFCRQTARQAENEAGGQLVWSGSPRDGEHSELTIVDSDGNVAGAEGSAIPGVDPIPVKLGGQGDGDGQDDGDGDGDPGDGEVGDDGEPGEDVWNQSPPPVFDIPSGLHFDVELDGGGLEGPAEEGFSFVSDGVVLGVDDLRLRDGDQQQVEVGPRKLEVDNDSDHAIAPELIYGDEHGGDGFEVTVETDGLDEDSDLELAARGGQRLKLEFDASGGDDAQVKIEVKRIDDEGDAKRAHTREVTLDDGEDGSLSFDKKAMRDGELQLKR